jgi:hypothetical protein
MYSSWTKDYGLILISLVSLARATPAQKLDKRTGCAQDNLLNAFSHRAAHASPYCSSYLSIPLTSTVYTYTVCFIHAVVWYLSLQGRISPQKHTVLLRQLIP